MTLYIPGGMFSYNCPFGLLMLILDNAMGRSLVTVFRKKTFLLSMLGVQSYGIF